MTEHSADNGDQAAAFQRIWTESMAKLMQAAFTGSPASPPPELIRQIRSGIFQVLAESWDQFMRSPEFLESMKQWMENAVAFRQMSNEFLGTIRNQAQTPPRADMESVMLYVRHMEQRLVDRIDALSKPPGRADGRVVRKKPLRKAKKKRPAKTR